MKANSERELALKRMSQVRKEHEDDMRKLDEIMQMNRRTHEEKLKKALEEKRIARLRELSDEKEK